LALSRVYYFLSSGVIGGGLFPQFKQIALHQLEFSETPVSELPCRCE
jgi:hypothetical protein